MPPMRIRAPRNSSARRPICRRCCSPSPSAAPTRPKTSSASTTTPSAASSRGSPAMPEHSLEILWPAFLAGLLVLSTHVPLGRMVLDRGIVFIDLAIAQVAGLGVVIADFLGWEPNGWSVQASAVTAALVAAAFLIWTEKH